MRLALSNSTRQRIWQKSNLAILTILAILAMPHFGNGTQRNTQRNLTYETATSFTAVDIRRNIGEPGIAFAEALRTSNHIFVLHLVLFIR
jgi:hypothetical protein